MKIVVLSEELDPKDKRRVDKWRKPRGYVSFTNKVFGGSPRAHHTIFIPLKSPESAHQADVHAHISSMGFTPHDYHAGLAKDRHGREVKIGKILSRSGASDLLNRFNTDPARAQHAAHKDHVVAITRHPHHVAGMTSCGHSWEEKSCMNFKTGGAKQYLPYEVEHGTHVAYLVHKDDKEIRKPLARIALKPYEGVSLTTGKPTKKTVHPAPRVYGDAPDSFRHTVENWASKIRNKSAVYHKVKAVYDDGQVDSLDSPDLAKLGRRFVSRGLKGHTSPLPYHIANKLKDAGLGSSKRLTAKAIKLGPDHDLYHAAHSSGVISDKHVRNTLRQHDDNVKQGRRDDSSHVSMTRMAANPSLSRKSYIKLAQAGYTNEHSPHNHGVDLAMKMMPGSLLSKVVSNTLSGVATHQDKAKIVTKIFKSNKVPDATPHYDREGSVKIRRRFLMRDFGEFLPHRHVVAYLKNLDPREYNIAARQSRPAGDVKGANALHRVLASRFPDAVLEKATSYAYNPDYMKRFHPPAPRHVAAAIKTGSRRGRFSLPYGFLSKGVGSHPVVARALIKHMPHAVVADMHAPNDLKQRARKALAKQDPEWAKKRAEALVAKRGVR